MNCVRLCEITSVHQYLFIYLGRKDNILRLSGNCHRITKNNPGSSPISQNATGIQYQGDGNQKQQKSSPYLLLVQQVHQYTQEKCSYFLFFGVRSTHDNKSQKHRTSFATSLHLLLVMGQKSISVYLVERKKMAFINGHSIQLV